MLVTPSSKLPSQNREGRITSSTTALLSTSGRTGLIAMGVAVLLAIPHLVGTNLPLWTSALGYVVIFGSLALLVWTSGQISICHMAFAAVGATTMSHVSGLPWLLALLVAGLAAIPVGAIVAVPAVRASGIYLALATLGFGILMQNVVFPTGFMFGRGLSVTAPRPQLGFIDSRSDTWLYYFVLLTTALARGAIALIARGRLGRVLRVMAETPTMLTTHGLNVNNSRLIVFCISAFFAAIGGALAVTQTGSASGVGYGPVQSLLLIAVLAICGTNLLRSAILAGALITLVPGYIDAFGTDQQALGFGTVAMLAAFGLARRGRTATWLAMAARTSAGRLRSGPVPARMASTAHAASTDAS